MKVTNFLIKDINNYMKKLVFFLVIFFSGCSAHDIALSIDNAKAKLREATLGLNQIKYGTKGIISDTPQKICSSSKDNYVTGLITVKGVPVQFNSPEFLLVTRYYGLIPGDYMETIEYQKTALLLTKVDENIYIFSDIGREYGSYYYEWAKERIEKHQKIEMQGVINDVYHRDNGCLLIISDIAITKD